MSNELVINQWLKDNYGQTVDSKAIFRLVWSTGLTEKRFGEYEEYTDSGIFLRSFKGVREVLKYPFAQNRWVLEKIELLPENSDIIAKFSYEPFYVFQKKNGEFLPLDRDIIQIAITCFLNKTQTSRLQKEEEKLVEGLAAKEKIRQLIGERLSTPHLMDLV